MDPLHSAAESPEINELMGNLYEASEVQGFVLGVHENYVSMFRGDYGSDLNVNEILDDTRTPHGWRDLCYEAGFEVELSPIYVAIYVTINENEFRERFAVPRVAGQYYGIFVEEAGHFRATRGKRRHRPIKGGTSIGSTATPNLAGTLGGFIEEVGTGETFLVTCNHVLSSSGMPVVQQGIPDGGQAPADTVGVTEHVVPLQPPMGYSLSAPYNRCDVAAARLTTGIEPTTSLRLLGTVSAIVARSQLAVGDEVAFVGKESDYQEAYVHSFVARIKVEINANDHNFGNVFEIRSRRRLYVGSLSRPGDSGSWVILRPSGLDKRLCGMLFADNSRQAALCSFAETFLTDLGNQANTQFKLA
jgi:hypothetical protein